jgi:hypothetical protein
LKVTDSIQRSPDFYIFLPLYSPSLPNTTGLLQSRCKMASLQLGGPRRQATRPPGSKSSLRYPLSITIVITPVHCVRTWNLHRLELLLALSIWNWCTTRIQKEGMIAEKRFAPAPGTKITHAQRRTSPMSGCLTKQDTPVLVHSTGFQARSQVISNLMPNPTT